MGDAVYPDVFKEYMLHKSATPAHGFQTNSLHGAGNFAVVGINISHAAGYGASDDQTTMAARHTAASDENVLAGTVYAPAVFIHAGIEGDAVVSGTKITVFNEYISAGIRIQAVRVGAFRMNMNVSDNDVFTVYRMKCPLRAVQNRNAFKKHAAAVDELEKGGAQGSSFCAVNTFAYGNAVRLAAAQPVSGGLLQLLPVPPGGAVPQESSFSGNRNIFTAFGIDQRGIVVTLHPLPAGEDRGKIIFRPAAEEDGSALFQMKPDSAAQMNGGGFPAPRRYADGSAAQGAAVFYGLLDGGKSGAVHFAVRENGFRNGLHGKRGTVRGKTLCQVHKICSFLFLPETDEIQKLTGLTCQGFSLKMHPAFKPDRSSHTCRHDVRHPLPPDYRHADSSETHPS